MPKTIYRPQYRLLAESLRNRREDLGINQTELARKLGWPQQRLSAVESGARRLDVFEYVELTDALELSPRKAFRLALASFAAPGRGAKRK